MFEACNFIKKEALAQVFPCEFCEISENTFFYRTPPVAASEDYKFLKDFKRKNNPQYYGWSSKKMKDYAIKN